MTITAFPPLSEADDDGLLAIGGDLDVSSLLLAYRSGIFPWPLHEHFLAWFAPPKRAILSFNDFCPSRSLRKARQHETPQIRVDTDFESVMRHCAEVKNRKGQRGTWITDAMLQAYSKLHQQGFAHSIECWQEDVLVGGLYGVAINGFFAGESMFYSKPNASKFCLLFLVEHLESKGATWLDTQVLNPFTEKMGAREIERERYLELLGSALAREVMLFP